MFSAASADAIDDWSAWTLARRLSTSPCAACNSAALAPPSAAYAASEWVRSIRLVRRDAWRLPRFREVRYEELVRDPVGRAVALFEWMGLAVA